MSIENLIGYLLTFFSTVILFMTLRVYRSQLLVFKGQLEKMQFQIKEDHERSRREETMRIMRFWSEAVASFPASLARLANICRKLTEFERSSFVNGTAFCVPAQEVDFILSFLSGCKKDDFIRKGDTYEIDSDSALTIRRQLVNYLNVMEVVAAAWVYQIGDRRMLEKEFHVAIDTNKDLIKAFNDKIHLYPSAIQFINRPRSVEQSDPTGV